MRPRACAAVLPVAGAVLCLLLALGGAQGKDADLFKFAKVYTRQLVELSTIILDVSKHFSQTTILNKHTRFIYFYLACS